MSGTLPVQSRSRRRALASRGPMGKGRPIRPGHVSGGGHAGRPTCEPVRSGASDPPDRSGRSAGSGDAVVRPGAGTWSPACTWKQGEAHGTHRKVQDDAGRRRRQPHPGGDATSAVVLVEAAGRLLPNAPPPWRARGRYHRPGPSSRATAPCRPRHPVRRHVPEGGGRLGVVEQVQDAGRRSVETPASTNASPRSATVGRRRYAALGIDVVHQVRRTAAGWYGCIVKRPCLAPPSRAEAMPSPDPPRHAKPRCLHPPDAALKQRPAARSPPRRRTARSGRSSPAASRRARRAGRPAPATPSACPCPPAPDRRRPRRPPTTGI